MSDETFRIVVAVGVMVAALSFLVVAVVAIFVLRLGMKFKAALDAILAKVTPIVQTVKDTAADLQPKVASISKQAVEVSKLVTTEAQRYSVVSKGFAEKAVDISGLVQTEAHRYADVSKDVAGLVKSEAHRYADISKDVADRAKVHIVKADEAIESAVDQVQNATVSAKSALLRPFREIDAVLTGVSTAVAAFARGRKSSVSRATQDEEMFI